MQAVGSTPAYPLELLSSLKYIRTISADDFPQDANVYLHRRSEVKREDCFYDGVVDRFHFKAENFDTIITHAFNLSLNLIGAKFDVSQHAHWRQLRPGCDPWDKATEINIKNFEGKYVSNPGDFPDFYFKAKDIHNKSIEYPRTFNAGKDAWPFISVTKGLSVVDSASADQTNKGPVTETVSGILYLCHRPTNLNYWHFQLESATFKKIFDNESKKEVTVREPSLEKHKGTPKIKSLIGKQQEHLLKVVCFTCPDPYIFPEEAYLAK